MVAGLAWVGVAGMVVVVVAVVVSAVVAAMVVVVVAGDAWFGVAVVLESYL